MSAVYFRLRLRLSESHGRGAVLAFVYIFRKLFKFIGIGLCRYFIGKCGREMLLEQPHKQVFLRLSCRANKNRVIFRIHNHELTVQTVKRESAHFFRLNKHLEAVARILIKNRRYFLNLA